MRISDWSSDVCSSDLKEARRVIIIGGGNIGLNLAHAVEKNQPQVNLKVIEVDKRRAEEVAQSLQRTVVIHGNALDTEILEEANAAATATVIDRKSTRLNSSH